MRELSIVVASRNDDHGGKMTERMCAFVSSLDHQTEKHGLSVELIMVEWNPVIGRPLLKDILPRPKSDLIVRYITVPAERHATYANASQIPLFQMLAKNVGIRRARGDYVLATNVDLFFSDELCAFMKADVLSEDAMYRANRCDVPVEVLRLSNKDELLKFCRSHVMRRIGCAPTCNAKRNYWSTVVKSLVGVGRNRGTFRRSIDTDACGDFTMMHKNAWELIRGYPELAMYSIYFDGLGCHTAVAMGLRQVVLPQDACTYHIDHASGWASMTTEEKMQAMSKKPALDYATYLEAVDKIWRNKQPLKINDDAWGLHDVELPECSISRSS